ncbi:MAG: flagellar motor protein MotB [Planctomycetes bacterium]|nr:flagellar motor protein MotB [Planctomycetota bacterium]
MVSLRRMAIVSLSLVAAAAATGCSTQKYQAQIDAKGAEVEALKQKSYQLELALSQKQAQIDELARRSIEPRDGRAGEESTALDTTPIRRGASVAPVADTSRLRGRGFQVSDVDGYPAIVLSGDIFDLGKATLTAKGQDELKKVAAVLRSDFAGHSFRVNGHTDNQPVKKHKDLYRSNWELSSLRACAVAEFLIETGKLDAKRIGVAGYADNRPRDSNASPGGRQRNRRAEIVIVD